MTDTIENTQYRNNLGHYRYRYRNSWMTDSGPIVNLSKIQTKILYKEWHRNFFVSHVLSPVKKLMLLISSNGRP